MICSDLVVSCSPWTTCSILIYMRPSSASVSIFDSKPTMLKTTIDYIAIIHILTT